MSPHKNKIKQQQQKHVFFFCICLYWWEDTLDAQPFFWCHLDEIFGKKQKNKKHTKKLLARYNENLVKTWHYVYLCLTGHYDWANHYLDWYENNTLLIIKLKSIKRSKTEHFHKATYTNWNLIKFPVLNSQNKQKHIRIITAAICSLCLIWCPQDSTVCKLWANVTVMLQSHGNFSHWHQCFLKSQESTCRCALEEPWHSTSQGAHLGPCGGSSSEWSASPSHTSLSKPFSVLASSTTRRTEDSLPSASLWMSEQYSWSLS